MSTPLEGARWSGRWSTVGETRLPPASTTGTPKAQTPCCTDGGRNLHPRSVAASAVRCPACRWRRGGDGHGPAELGRRLDPVPRRRAVNVPAKGPVARLDRLAQGRDPRGRRTGKGGGSSGMNWERRSAWDRLAEQDAK